MWRIVGLLVVAVAGISCDGRSEAVVVPADRAVVVQPDLDEDPVNHPADHPLRMVSMLIGMPSQEMIDQMRQGQALLGGCVGSPDQTSQAEVCDRCRLWKTDGMKTWQVLPEQFGELAAKNEEENHR